MDDTTGREAWAPGGNGGCSTGDCDHTLDIGYTLDDIRTATLTGSTPEAVAAARRNTDEKGTSMTTRKTGTKEQATAKARQTKATSKPRTKAVKAPNAPANGVSGPTNGEVAEAVALLQAELDANAPAIAEVLAETPNVPDEPAPTTPDEPAPATPEQPDAEKVVAAEETLDALKPGDRVVIVNTEHPDFGNESTYTVAEVREAKSYAGGEAVPNGNGLEVVATENRGMGNVRIFAAADLAPIGTKRAKTTAPAKPRTRAAKSDAPVFEAPSPLPEGVVVIPGKPYIRERNWNLIKAVHVDGREVADVAKETGVSAKQVQLILDIATGKKPALKW